MKLVLARPKKTNLQTPRATKYAKNLYVSSATRQCRCLLKISPSPATSYCAACLPKTYPNSFVLDSIQGLLVTGARNGREGLEILVSEREPRYATLQGAEGRVKIPNEAPSRILRHYWPAPVAGPDRITASNVNVCRSGNCSRSFIQLNQRVEGMYTNSAGFCVLGTGTAMNCKMHLP